MQAGSRQWWHAAVTCCITGAVREPPTSRPDVAPRFVFVEAVERMTRDDARLAAGAAVEVDFEGILLAGPGGVAGKSRRYCASGLSTQYLAYSCSPSPSCQRLNCSTAESDCCSSRTVDESDRIDASDRRAPQDRSRSCQMIGSEISRRDLIRRRCCRLTDQSAWPLQSVASLQPISVAITGSSTSGGGSSTYTCPLSTFTRKCLDAILFALQRLARFERERFLVQRASDLRLLAGGRR